VFVYSRMWECGKCWYRATEKPNRQPKFGVKNRSKPTGNAKSRTVTTLDTVAANSSCQVLKHVARQLADLGWWAA